MRRAAWAALGGTAAFLSAHAIEVAAHIGGDHPWFISELPSMLFTAGAMFVAGAIAGAVHRGAFEQLPYPLAGLVVGAAVPMAITLFTHPNGPGNLFPIALMVGTAVLAISSAAGLGAGWLLRHAGR